MLVVHIGAHIGECDPIAALAVVGGTSQMAKNGRSARYAEQALKTAYQAAARPRASPLPYLR